MRTQPVSHSQVSQVTTRPAAGVRRSQPAVTGGASFQQVLGARAPAAVTTSPATAPGVKRLGPFTSDPGMRPADPAAFLPAGLLPATSTPQAPAAISTATPQAPATPQMAPPVSWNPYDRASHEDRMNAWYMSYAQNRNDEKMKIYQMALHDWQVNDQIYKNLGMKPVPPPTPPVLDPVAPMPPGWWFGNVTT